MTTFASLIQQAEARRARSQFKTAQAAFLKAVKAAPGPDAQAQAWQGVADCARLLGNFPGALLAYGAALKLAPAGDRAFRADLWCGQALAQRASGKPAEALKGLDQALAAYRGLKDAEGQAFCHWALGGTLRIAGDLLAARKHLLLAEKAFAKLGQAEGASYVDCALGGVNRMLGRRAENQRYYARASARMRVRQDPFGIAYSWCGLGNVARMDGDLAAALKHFRKAETGYARIGDKVSYAYTLWSLGTTFKLMERFPEARRALAKADGLFRRTKDGRGQAYVQQALAEIEALEGHPAKGLARLKRGVALVRPYAWEARHHRALTALLQGKPLAAERAYRGSGSSFKPSSLPVNWP
jgi:tetratricopeptide (TPR) repeat protein